MAVPLGPAARRRVRVATALMDYIAAINEGQGKVTIPADRIIAKNAEGQNAAVTLEEIGSFIERMTQAGKLTNVEVMPDSYAFRIVRKPLTMRSHAKAGTSQSPGIGQIMRVVLAAVDAGAKHHAAVRSAVSKALALPVRTTARHVSEHSFEDRLALCIEQHKSLGYIQREGRAISILPRGHARLQDNRPFEGDEIPKKYRRPDKGPNTVRQLPAVNARDANRLLQTIPTLPPERLIVLWSNAVKVLSVASGTAEHERARKVLDAVETAWDALDKKRDDEFAWPSTEVRGHSGTLTVPAFRSEGMLSYLEYRVGKTASLPAVLRQSILARVFEGRLPRVFDAEYMRAWGSPASAQRLRKMAESLAAFARNGKRSGVERLEEAIRQWEQDLEFLYERYYVGRFGFGWPTTSINDPGRMLVHR
ncbi:MULTISPECIES: hypothetical protein [unclassified Mesorhizobium]|uniref:hypothetical protein n=1 Tax=unclassified Mesorhizobium TaxID=325217 RepID=UPI000FD75000|nr:MULTISPECIES: hypothetical protein [unclassified Mesorhizobium]TGQ16371.1 hypothetical protein EN862_002410 [Mesorhizobium sp. M2E.F.Ca.ET.219.01.1.1]TGT77532.1 hypothetical protein EN809_008150 [Mesorhizobium sp. M2E.F.Ca.ET.166.01.1.1]TGW03641.1 hypothetical protein EN797_008150 [Mesorhizobium sp. M2E.F.Ca.ET.154.01.1.1]